MSKSDTQIVCERYAAHQGYTLVDYHDYFDVNHGVKVIEGRMKDREDTFRFSPKLHVWYAWTKETPEEALKALGELRQKEALNTRMNQHKGTYARVLRVRVDSANDPRGYRLIEWKHGKGTCGRTVVGLKHCRESMPGWLTIWQWCEDSFLPDEFCYPLARINQLRIYTTDNPEVITE